MTPFFNMLARDTSTAAHVGCCFIHVLTADARLFEDLACTTLQSVHPSIHPSHITGSTGPIPTQHGSRRCSTNNHGRNQGRSSGRSPRAETDQGGAGQHTQDPSRKTKQLASCAASSQAAGHVGGVPGFHQIHQRARDCKLLPAVCCRFPWLLWLTGCRSR